MNTVITLKATELVLSERIRQHSIHQPPYFDSVTELLENMKKQERQLYDAKIREHKEQVLRQAVQIAALGHLLVEQVLISQADTTFTTLKVDSTQQIPGLEEQ